MPSRATVRSAAGAAVAALALALTLLAGGARPAWAHATLIGTAPAADEVVDAVPDVVELRFDEPVETTAGAVQVFGPGGDRVDEGTVETVDGGATLRAPIEGDEQGTYTVAWRVTSEDSHTLTGSFVFHNGTRTGAVAVDDGGGDTVTDVAGGLGRWLGYGGTLATVGAAALALLLTRRGPGATAGPGLDRPGAAGPPQGASAPADGPAPADATGRVETTARTGADGSAPAGRPGGAGPAVPPVPYGAGTPAGTTGLAGAGGSAPAREADPGDRGRTATLVAPAGAVPGPGASHHEAGARARSTVATAGPASARLRRLALAGSLVGAVGALVALVAMVADSAGRGLVDAVDLVPDLAPDSRTGQLALLRVAATLGAAAVAAVPGLWRRSPLPVVALAAGALVATSLAGHAWTAPDRWLAVAADVVHVGAVALWAGGLLALLAVLPLVPAPADRLRLATRFSGLAVGAVAVVAASGTVSAWQQVGGVDALASTAYGRLLMAKVAGFAALVALGWINRSRLVPLVARAVAPLQRSLRIEVAVAVVVLALTAALVQQPPARSGATAGPFDTTATAPSGEVVTVTVDPAAAGLNDIHLYFFADSGTTPLTVDAVQVTVSTSSVPPRRLQATPVTTNHVTVAGASLPSPGTWTVEVTAVHAGEPLVFTIEVPIA